MPAPETIRADGDGKFILPHASGELIRASSASLDMSCFLGNGRLAPTLQMAGEPIPVLQGSRIITANSKLAIAYFITPVNFPFNEFGGIDQIITLFSKPTGPFVFDFDASNLIPYLQPPLSDEKPQPNWVSITETDAFDKDGKVVCHRPFQIVGGLAWYHPAKGGLVTAADVANRITTGSGMKSYAMFGGGTYWRYRILNASQYELYPVDPSVLDKGPYPMVIQPLGDTFGYTSVGATSTNTVDVAYILTPASTVTGTITKYTAYIDDIESGGYGYKIALYTFGSGTIYDYVADTVATATNTGSPAWRDTGAISTAINGDYFLSFDCERWSCLFFYDSTGGYNAPYANGSSYANYPTSTVNASNPLNSVRASIYGTYTVGGGGTTYDETGRVQVILATAGQSAQLTIGEKGKTVTILAAHGQSSSATWKEAVTQTILANCGHGSLLTLGEVGRLQVVLAALGEADAATWQETGHEALVLALQGHTDMATWEELAHVALILAPQGEADSATWQEAVGQVLLAAIGGNAYQNFIEAVGQVITAQTGRADSQTMSEAHGQAVRAMCGRTDVATFMESALVLILAALGRTDYYIPGNITIVELTLAARSLALALQARSRSLTLKPRDLTLTIEQREDL